MHVKGLMSFYKLKLLKFTLIALYITCNVSAVFAQEHNEADAPEEEFTFVAIPKKKEAIYKKGEKIEYSIDIYNSYDEVQEGTISYLISTVKNEEVATKSIPVKLGKHAKEKYTLNLPSNSDPGFYKVNFMINVTEYDDTLRRVIGIDVKNIKKEDSRPIDFDDFWAQARLDLNKVKPDFRFTEKPEMAQGNTNVYLVEMRSLDNLLIRGWLTMPKNRKPNQKLPVWMVVPGYGDKGLEPTFGNPDMAVFFLNIRGEGNSRDVLHPTRDGYLTTNIEHRNQYIYRGAIMDCIRGVDFLFSRPELDTANIICTGGSMGAYLSIAACSLDNRIKLCSANNPVFCDFRGLYREAAAGWPMNAIIDYSKHRFIPMEKLLSNLDYYDLKNFSSNLKCKSLIGVSLLDNLAPPQFEYSMLNNIPVNYKLFVYPELAHEVPPSHSAYLVKWMMDEFGIF